MVDIEIILLLSSTAISIIVFMIAIFCCRNVIMRNGANPVFQLRRPYFVSYIVIIISINMLLRSIIALLLYNSLISMIIFRECVRFLAIFGEILCLLQRMYFLVYDLKHVKYKENKLLSKYLQRGNDIKQTLHLMSQFATIQKGPTPSVATNSFASEQLSLKKNKNDHIDIKFNPNIATIYEKMLYYNQYFGNVKVMTSIFCSILVISIFLPGLFVCIFVQTENFCYDFQNYITNIFALALVILYLLFVIYISYNPFTPNFSDSSNWVNKYACYKCYRNKFNKETDKNNIETVIDIDNDMKQKHKYIYKQNLHLSNYDDYYISLELTIILLIIAILCIIFITIEILNHYNYFDNDFYFVLLYIIILTIGGILIIFTLTFIPYFAIQKLHKKYQFGKLKSKQYQLELKDILSHYKGFYAFAKTLFEEHSIENLMFLIEIWQYKYYPHTHINNNLENKMETIVNNNDNNNNNEENEENDNEGNNIEKDTNTHTLFNMKVNMMLNALEDTTSEASEDYDDYNEEYEYNDDYNEEYYEYNTDMIYNLHLQQSKEEMNECLRILFSFPWFKIPISDSHRKYNDKYFCAVHIFNKYLSRSAFDLLNVSQMSLTHIESTLHCLYEYKLQSYNIGIELDENEKKQLKFDCGLSTQSTSRHTNFDFVEPSPDIMEDNNTNIGTINETCFDKNTLENICVTNISNNISISSERTPNDYYSPTVSNDINEKEKENYLKEIKRKQKLRERLGLKIYFTSNAMYKKIQNDKEFEEKLLSVFDICLADIFNNLECAFLRFKTTKEYYCCLADKLQLLN